MSGNAVKFTPPTSLDVPGYVALYRIGPGRMKFQVTQQVADHFGTDYVALTRLEGYAWRLHKSDTRASTVYLDKKTGWLTLEFSTSEIRDEFEEFSRTPAKYKVTDTGVTVHLAGIPRRPITKSATDARLPSREEPDSIFSQILPR